MTAAWLRLTNRLLHFSTVAPRISGPARVLRNHGGSVHGLRFKRLPEEMLADLGQLAWTDLQVIAPDPQRIPRRTP